MKDQNEVSNLQIADPTSNKNLRELLVQIIEHSEKETTRTHTPHWDARNDLVKTVIGLASGSIVLTVTFSNSLTKSGTLGAWKYLLFGAWLSFLVSIAAAIFSLAVSLKLKKFSSFWWDRKTKVLTVIDNGGSSEEIAATLTEGLPAFGKADKFASWLLGASLFALIVALALLSLFGWNQLAA